MTATVSYIFARFMHNIIMFLNNRVKPEIGCTTNKVQYIKGLPIYAQSANMISIQDVVIGILLSSKLEEASLF